VQTQGPESASPFVIQTSQSNSFRTQPSNSKPNSSNYSSKSPLSSHLNFTPKNPPKPYTTPPPLQSPHPTAPHHTSYSKFPKTYTPVELPFLYNLSYFLCDSGVECRSYSAAKISCLVLCFDGGFWKKFWFYGMGLRLEFDKEDRKPGLG